jgi:hypothetical protein
MGGTQKWVTTLRKKLMEGFVSRKQLEVGGRFRG